MRLPTPFRRHHVTDPEILEIENAKFRVEVARRFLRRQCRHLERLTREGR